MSSLASPNNSKGTQIFPPDSDPHAPLPVPDRQFSGAPMAGHQYTHLVARDSSTIQAGDVLNQITNNMPFFVFNTPVESRRHLAEQLRRIADQLDGGTSARAPPAEAGGPQKIVLDVLLETMQRSSYRPTELQHLWSLAWYLTVMVSSSARGKLAVSHVRGYTQPSTDLEMNPWSSIGKTWVMEPGPHRILSVFKSGADPREPNLRELKKSELKDFKHAGPTSTSLRLQVLLNRTWQWADLDMSCLCDLTEDVAEGKPTSKLFAKYVVREFEICNIRDIEKSAHHSIEMNVKRCSCYEGGENG